MSENNSKVNGGAHCLIGRFQPFHKGHYELINQYLEKGEKVVVLIMDTPIDVDNPFTITERMLMIDRAFHGYTVDALTIRSIPPIMDVSIGRKCGFAIRELDSRGKEHISATDIRGLMRSGHDTWEQMVPLSIVPLLRNCMYRGVLQ